MIELFKVESAIMSKIYPLDKTDRKILQALQINGRMSNQELADLVSLSPSPCLRRVKQLEDAGVINRYVALIDPPAIGLGLLAYVNVKLEKRLVAKGKFAFEEFREEVLLWPEVVACYSMTGDLDYLLRVQVENLDAYSAFVMNRLLKHPAVLDVRSSFALERIKETTALPL
jgi:Lrp/AsnC family transcriptional regulator, leucine-responsive regulatory protein